jgi:hypothetical protein
MALLTSSVALILWTCFLTSAIGPTVAPQGASITAKWRADLRAAVGSAPLGLVVGRGRETHAQPRTSLWFLPNNRIVATFVIREGKTALSSRNSSDTNLPLRLRAIFIDASSGKVTSTQDWPSTSRFAGIVASNGGKFVAQMGTSLTLYSSDVKELTKLSLPPLPQEFWGWHAFPSPTSKSILFATNDLTTTSATLWIWVDTNSLQVVRSWKEIQSGWMGISDSTIAMTACSFWNYHCDPNVEVRSLATEWKTIAPIKKRSQQFPQFVNEDILFLSGEPWKLLQTDGKVILTGDASSEGSTAISSAGGKRFVVPFFKLIGRVAALDIGGHSELKTISIYDAPFHERSYRLAVEGPKIKDLSQLALSPDGSLLAILYDESVYLFHLPPPPSTM